MLKLTHVPATLMQRTTIRKVVKTRRRSVENQWWRKAERGFDVSLLGRNS
jgi:hypothetical protein